MLDMNKITNMNQVYIIVVVVVLVVLIILCNNSSAESLHMPIRHGIPSRDPDKYAQCDICSMDCRGRAWRYNWDIYYHCGDKCEDDEQCVQDCGDARDARTKKYSSKCDEYCNRMYGCK